MPIQSIKSGTLSRSTAVGNAIILPGDFESIATVTLSSASSSSVQFTSIPQTFTHLQVRIITRSTFAATEWPIFVQPNSNGSSIYAYHNLQGNGSTASASGAATQSLMQLGDTSAANGLANSFGIFILDILDYANTNKNKTVRTLYGYDLNGSGTVGMRSGLFATTTAISSLSFGTGANFAQYSHFALYGIRG